MVWLAHNSVATIVEREGLFLMVEERDDARVVFNQPAGHLDEHESLFDAAVRETLEETAWHVELTAFLGVYQYLAPNGVTYIRHCFAAKPLRHAAERQLDDGIIAAHWLPASAILDPDFAVRSPIVARCLRDYLRGKRYPLDLIQHVTRPTLSLRARPAIPEAVEPATPNPGGKVIVGMSGGVDSSVAALLLLEQGYEVEGLFMKNWDEDDGSAYCTAIADLADAQAVCDKLGITLHTANFAAEYWDRVFEHFLHEYRAGRTPNPDILCNREIKFKAFLDYALVLGAERIATGHYARLEHDAAETRLCKAVDRNKDQSYFLSAVSEEQLRLSLFPVGELTKPDVRALAAKHGFITHDKKDSTGICFIGERRFRDFLSTYLPAQPGRIETPEGKVLGEHHGLMYHTLGQREGLGIGGVRGGMEEPWYVAAKDLDRNVLIVVQGNAHPLLYTDTLSLTRLDWINHRHPALPLRCAAKTRYRQADQDCEVVTLPDGGAQVRFDRPQRSVTPGQQLVLYLGDHCLGGGVIERTWNA